MPLQPLCMSLAAAILAGTLPAAANAVSAEPKTAAAVLAADDAWGDAEGRGDAAFVDALLMPDYRSVGASGKSTLKAAIVAGARARAGSPMAAEAIAAWKAEHPLRGDVVLNGDTAVLTWVSLKPSAGQPISSSDIFVYRGGRWHPIYSQHTGVSE